MRMDSIETEMTEIIDRFRVADHRHTEALRQREKYQHHTYKTLRRVPRTADPSSSSSAGARTTCGWNATSCSIG
jgi:hypothetical protein